MGGGDDDENGGIVQTEMVGFVGCGVGMDLTVFVMVGFLDDDHLVSFHQCKRGSSSWNNNSPLTI